nr:hypothetical protein BaRGS_032640 [Batillaria attramentaria]
MLSEDAIKNLAQGLAYNGYCKKLDLKVTNGTLRALDLRNNQINHEGAEELACALKRNISLRALGFKTFVAETAVDNNADRHTLSDEHLKRTHALSQQLKHVEKERGFQITDLMDQIDYKEELLRKSKRLSMTESELVLAEQKANDYGSVINRLKQEMAELAVKHQNDLRQEKEERANMEMKYLKEFSDLQEKHLQSTNKITHVKQEAEELERSLRERIQKMESHRLELEEEISRLKSNNLVDKLNAEEQLQSSNSESKQKRNSATASWKNECACCRRARMSYRVTVTSRHPWCRRLQSKNSGLTLEVDNLKRRLEEMGQREREREQERES